MKLRGKILSGFFVLTLMLLIAGVWSIYQLTSIGASVQQLLDDNYRSIEAADKMLGALEREDSAVLLLLLGRWEEGREVLVSADSEFEAALQVAEGNVTIPGEADLIEEIREAHGRYEELWARPIVDTPREGNLTWYFQDTHRAFLAAKGAVSALKQLNEESLYRTASDLKNRAGRAVVPGTVASLSALIFSILFAYFVDRLMITPIVQITRAAEEFARAQKPFALTVATHDEIEKLASAVRNLCASVGNEKGWDR